MLLVSIAKGLLLGRGEELVLRRLKISWIVHSIRLLLVKSRLIGSCLLLRITHLRIIGGKSSSLGIVLLLLLHRIKLWCKSRLVIYLCHLESLKLRINSVIFCIRILFVKGIIKDSGCIIVFHIIVVVFVFVCLILISG